jgi:hypothetical protein
VRELKLDVMIHALADQDKNINNVTVNFLKRLEYVGNKY